MLTSIAALATLSHAGMLSFPPVELSPVSGDLAGYDGDTVIWGVSLMNNDPNGYWWVITGVTSDYTSTGTPGEIPAGPSFFTDLLSPYFFVSFFLNGQALAPNQDLNLSSPGSPVDLASFQISATADPGTVFGQLHIFYDVWDSNPFDPNNASAKSDRQRPVRCGHVRDLTGCAVRSTGGGARTRRHMVGWRCSHRYRAQDETETGGPAPVITENLVRAPARRPYLPEICFR